jgi:SAM-dependent methyltransferase
VSELDRRSTAEIYDGQATRWARDERVMLSDFTARPRVLDELGPLGGCHVLDLGCGEGYVARQAAALGAASVFGVDVSPEMVANANAAVPRNSRCEMVFETADAATYADYPRATFDRIMAVFLFNYLTRAEMTRVLTEVRRVLAPGGRFVFTVPHPCFPYMRTGRAPFYFDTGGVSYLAGADQTYEGQIWRRDGEPVHVRCVHKTLTDYFASLTEAGFTSLPAIVELAVTEEHLGLDPEFFGPLEGYPLHLLFRLDA